MPRGEALNASSFELSHSRWLVLPLLAAAACSSLVAATAKANAPSSHKAEPVPYIGFDTDLLQSPYPNVASSESDAIRAANGNLGRIYIRYVPGSAEVRNTLKDICTASRSAYDNGQQIVYVFEGLFRPDPRSADPKKRHYREGYIPNWPNQRNRFVSMVANMMWGVASDKNSKGTGGCVPEQKNLTISLIKEPNYSGNPNQEQNMRYAANLYTYAYDKLHSEATKPGLNVNLKIVGAELSTSPYSHPAESAVDLRRYMGDQQGFDELGLHLFANKEDVESGTAKGTLRTLSRMLKLVRSLWGNDMPVAITELGGNSPTSPSEETQYKVKLGSNTFRGGKLAVYYNQVVDWAACENISEVDFFHLTDDPGESHWRSGLRTPHGEWKPIAGSVSTNNLAARKGGLIDCPAQVQ